MLLLASFALTGRSYADDATPPLPTETLAVPTLEWLGTEPPATEPPSAPPTDTALPPSTETATVPIESPSPAQVPTEVPTQLAPSATPVPRSYPSTPLPGLVPSTIEPVPTEPGAGPGDGDPAATPTGEPALYTATLTGTPTPSQTSTATGTATITSTPTMTPTATPDWLPPGPECKPVPGEVIVQLPVPYVHQVLDIGGADGNWACGPTSLVMVLAYYGKLDVWSDYMAQQGTVTTTATILPTVTRIPGSSSQVTPARVTGTRVATPGTIVGGRNFAPYVTSEYSNNGYTYDALARDPQGDPVAGLYGAICATGFADWTRMATVLRQHGLQSRYIGANWDAVAGALDRGHPVVLGNDLTASGHVLVATGYTRNGHLLVNDPYGNRFAPGYGSTNGQGLLYPWDCARVRTALEVIGEYPPPPRASATGTQTATTTAVPPAPQPPTPDPASQAEQAPLRDSAAPRQPTSQSVRHEDTGSDSFGGTASGTTSSRQSHSAAKTTIPASGDTRLGGNSQATEQETNAIHSAVGNADAQTSTWLLSFEWGLLSTLCAVLALVGAVSCRRFWFPTVIYVTAPDTPTPAEPVHDPAEVPGTGEASGRQD
ncbi:MAG TPA: C39 family peptidase [Chloroflexia bacterium]